MTPTDAKDQKSAEPPARVVELRYCTLGVSGLLLTQDRIGQCQSLGV